MNGPLVLRIAIAAALLASLPYWLPARILRLRAWLFTRINGEEGVPVPGPLAPVENFRALYGHPAACGRSAGAPLSDLFWYWLSPGAELHQEHLEPGLRYEEVATVTRRFLAVPTARAEQLATDCTNRVLDEAARGRMSAVRLRDLMMPVWAAFYYELVFDERCPKHARDLIVGNADDVVTALKGCGLRHMSKRRQLTRFLREKVEAGLPVRPLPVGFSAEEQALYLQGVFFNTAVVQMSEAMTHLLLVLAAHPGVQGDVVAQFNDAQILDRVIAETLRMFPLFGIAHRITAEDIRLDGAAALPKGSVLCFNYDEYQRSGFADPDRFDPDRWRSLKGRDATYIPFGILANRPCPAQAIALVTMRAATRAVLARFTCSSSASHTRSIPNRGPCLLLDRLIPPAPWRKRAALQVMRLRDRWEDVWRSVVQLVLGTAMVLHARRLKLCANHFAEARCPFNPDKA